MALSPSRVGCWQPLNARAAPANQSKIDVVSVVLILFLSSATPSADYSIASESFPTMQTCEAAGRAEQSRRRGRVVLWACVTRAPG